jgi:hypothetical protein
VKSKPAVTNPLAKAGGANLFGNLDFVMGAPKAQAPAPSKPAASLFGNNDDDDDD